VLDISGGVSEAVLVNLGVGNNGEGMRGEGVQGRIMCMQSEVRKDIMSSRDCRRRRREWREWFGAFLIEALRRT
jgi:hypothetical protein